MATTVISSDQARWREVLDTVVSGNDVIIERYGKPVAILIPYQDYEAATATPSQVRETQTFYRNNEWESVKAELIAEIKAELLAEGSETWAVNWQLLRRQVADRGGLLAGLSKDEIIAQLRQTRDEIFAAEYAHLY